MEKDDRNSEAPTQVAAVPLVFSIHCIVFLKNKICINQKEITYVNTGTGTSQVWGLFMNLKKKSIIITYNFQDLSTVLDFIRADLKRCMLKIYQVTIRRLLNRIYIHYNNVSTRFINSCNFYGRNQEQTSVEYRGVTGGGGQLPLHLLAEQKAPPQLPHFYLPPQFQRATYAPGVYSYINEPSILYIFHLCITYLPQNKTDGIGELEVFCSES